MKKIFLFLLSAFFLFSCSQENIDQLSESENYNARKSENIYVCTADFYEGNDFPSNQKAAILKTKKWEDESIITIKFLNGSPSLEDKVMKYVLEWGKLINLEFRKNPRGNADIKVAFKWNGDKTSWSYHGIDSKTILQDQPSMNFGWLDESTSEEEFRRVVLHEFGHALGLVHEHLHPINNIQWNKDVVYAYYAQQGWNKATVDRNIFNKFTTTQTNYSTYDKYSIMHYDIPSSHTLNNYSVGINNVLSQKDIEFISQQYPIKTAKNALFYGKDHIKVGEFRTSENGVYSLTLENTGDLILRKNNNTILWSIETGYNDVTAVSISIVRFQINLDFKLSSISRPLSVPLYIGDRISYDSSLNLRIENNGNLVLDTGNKIIWKSNTDGK